MKAKGSTSLYEVLKSASRPGGDPAGAAPAPAPVAEGAPAPTLQERLAAYKAAKLAEATSPSPAPEAAPEPAVATAVAEPTPPPAPKPASVVAPAIIAPPPPAPTLEAVEAPPADGPGERVLRLTYNTVAFAGLVAVGLLFVAYALGARSGRQRAEPAPEPAPTARQIAIPTPPPPPPPPPPPAKIHTIWLGEWKYGMSSERLKADEAVSKLKAALDRAGLKGAKTMQVRRGAEPRLGLHIDEVAEIQSADAKARLETLKKFRFGTQAPFAQASYVELPK
jgi:hypothetical protein